MALKRRVGVNRLELPENMRKEKITFSRLWKCDACGALFSTKPELNRHLRYHGNRPHDQLDLAVMWYAVKAQVYRQVLDLQRFCPQIQLQAAEPPPGWQGDLDPDSPEVNMAETDPDSIANPDPTPSEIERRNCAQEANNLTIARSDLDSEVKPPESDPTDSDLDSEVKPPQSDPVSTAKSVPDDTGPVSISDLVANYLSEDPAAVDSEAEDGNSDPNSEIRKDSEEMSQNCDDSDPEMGDFELDNVEIRPVSTDVWAELEALTSETAAQSRVKAEPELEADQGAVCTPPPEEDVARDISLKSAVAERLEEHPSVEEHLLVEEHRSVEEHPSVEERLQEHLSVEEHRSVEEHPSVEERLQEYPSVEEHSSVEELTELKIPVEVVQKHHSVEERIQERSSDHERLHENPSVEEVTEQKIVGDIVKCRGCRADLTHLSSLRSHTRCAAVLAPRSKPFSCNRCGVYCRSAEACVRHVRLRHFLRYQCPSCPRRARTAAGVRRHVAEAHTRGRCEVCGVMLPGRRLAAHRKLHQRESEAPHHCRPPVLLREKLKRCRKKIVPNVAPPAIKVPTAAGAPRSIPNILRRKVLPKVDPPPKADILTLADLGVHVGNADPVKVVPDVRQSVRNDCRKKKVVPAIPSQLFVFKCKNCAMLFATKELMFLHIEQCYITPQNAEKVVPLQEDIPPAEVPLEEIVPPQQGVLLQEVVLPENVTPLEEVVEAKKVVPAEDVLSPQEVVPQEVVPTLRTVDRTSITPPKRSDTVTHTSQSETDHAADENIVPGSSADTVTTRRRKVVPMEQCAKTSTSAPIVPTKRRKIVPVNSDHDDHPAKVVLEEHSYAARRPVASKPPEPQPSTLKLTIEGGKIVRAVGACDDKVDSNKRQSKVVPAHQLPAHVSAQQRKIVRCASVPARRYRPVTVLPGVSCSLAEKRVCPVCGRSVRNLSKHLASHRLFCCVYCQENFARFDMVMDHMMTGHGCDAQEYGRGAEELFTEAEGHDAETEGLCVQSGRDKNPARSSQADRYQDVVAGLRSQAQGYQGDAAERRSQAEGYQCDASGPRSKAEPYHADPTELRSPAEGYQGDSAGLRSQAQGYQGGAAGLRFQAEGYQSDAARLRSQAEGYQGDMTGLRSQAEGHQGDATELRSQAEGYQSDAAGLRSQAERYQDEPAGLRFQAQGYQGDATALRSQAEGYQDEPAGLRFQAQGHQGDATALRSQAEGYAGDGRPRYSCKDCDALFDTWYELCAHTVDRHC